VYDKAPRHEKVEPAQRRLVRIAADILAESDDAIGVTYSGFCQPSLPHKKLGGSAPSSRTVRSLGD
jgi:hypothetical protein